MVEILFSEAAAGSMKSAKGYGEGSFKGTGIGVVIVKQDGSKPTEEEIKKAQDEALEKARTEWEQAVPVDINPDDIFCFDLSWDIGDISDGGIDEKRLAVLKALYSIYDEDTQKGAKIQYETAKQNFEKVMKRISAGENVRVWYSDNPAERCGMLWFMAQMRNVADYSGKVYTVKTPKYSFDEETNTITEFNSWGEIEPSKWYRYFELSQDKTREYWGYAQQWWNLMRENADLRAVVNGKVRGVSEDIYDRYIWEEIDLMDDEFIQAVVIGKVLGKHQLGIGDAFVALRMEKFIESDILSVVPKTSRGPASYHRKLRKNY